MNYCGSEIDVADVKKLSNSSNTVFSVSILSNLCPKCFDELQKFLDELEEAYK